MSELMLKVIKNSYPDYDENRYSYKFGDVIRTNSGALVLIFYSAIDFVEAYVIRSGFGFKKNQRMKISYNDLPYVGKDDFVSEELEISTSIKWDLGDIVVNPRNGDKLLIEEKSDSNGFYATVLESDNEYYTETRIYVKNPYSAYLNNWRN